MHYIWKWADLVYKKFSLKAVYKYYNLAKKAGLTFVEMLIVVAMIAMISLAIYSVFNSGAKIWQKINKNILKEDLNIFLDKFSSDLRNCFKFKGIEFYGTEDELHFASIVDSDNIADNTPGEIVYSYNAWSKSILRQQRDFSQLYLDSSGRVQHILDGVVSVRFLYYFYEQKKNKFLWVDEWIDKDTLPVAVRVELELEDADSIKKYIRTIYIPSASGF